MKLSSINFRELGALAITLSALFLFFALLTFNPHDASWFYFSSQASVTNVFGAVGAHVAALFFYLFGGAAFLFVALVLWCAYMLFFRVPFKNEWERIFALSLLPLVCASLAALYGGDLYGVIPGGYVGRALSAASCRWFEYVGGLAFLHVLLFICSVLVFRFSSLRAVRMLLALLAFVTCKEKFLYPVARGARRAVYVVTRPLVALWALGKRFIFGPSAEQERSIFDFDYEDFMKNNAPLFDTAAWEFTADAPKAADEYVKTTQGDVQDLFADSDAADELFESVEGVLKPEPQGAFFDTEHGAKAVDEPAPQTTVQEKNPLPQSYQLPNLNIFTEIDSGVIDKTLSKELEERARILEEKLQRFGVAGKVVAIKFGPVVTVFEYQPDIDSKISRIIALEDDLAMALQALSIRIIAPIPGRSVVGFEVANKHRKSVILSHIVQSPEFSNFTGFLPLVLGEDTVGKKVVVDLVAMPHLLIAGSTGSGKSVALNAMLVSLLCRRTPDELRLILVDPKRLEFASYADIAHLLFPIVTNPKQAAPVLRWVVREMEQRYEKMAQAGVRNIFDYKKLVAREAAREQLPFIVVIIDELADLMMTAGKEIEDLIARLAQMARAAGIHLIVATQRPSVDVITGLIKVNFPSRISFRVTSKVDSRTILDCSGADKLLGKGDMLFLDSGESRLKRVHGAYVSDNEIEQLVQHIKAQRVVEYCDLSEDFDVEGSTLLETDDELYRDVVTFLDEIDEISISLLQRKFRIGYNRSARIIDMLESQGHIMPAHGSKLRKVNRS